LNGFVGILLFVPLLLSAFYFTFGEVEYFVIINAKKNARLIVNLTVKTTSLKFIYLTECDSFGMAQLERFLLDYST